MPVTAHTRKCPTKTRTTTKARGRRLLRCGKNALLVCTGGAFLPPTRPRGQSGLSWSRQCKIPAVLHANNLVARPAYARARAWTRSPRPMIHLRTRDRGGRKQRFERRLAVMHVMCALATTPAFNHVCVLQITSANVRITSLLIASWP